RRGEVTNSAPTLTLPRLRGREVDEAHGLGLPPPQAEGWGRGSPERTSPRISRLLDRRVVAEGAGQDFEAGHAHRDPHLHLLANEAAIDVVGDLAADLNAAVHRSRMHDQGVGLGQL